MMSLVKKGTKKDRTQGIKMKEKVIDVTTKLDMKKILPTKSTKATPRSPIPNEPQKPIEEGDALAKAEAAVEKRAKEKSIK